VGTIPAAITGVNVTSGSNLIPVYTLINSGSIPVSVQFLAAAETSGQAVCPGGGSIYTITVNPTPVADDPSNQILCAGGITNAVVPSGTGTGYQWTNDQTSIGLSAAGTGTIPSFSAVNSSTSPVVSTISITPLFSNNGVVCSGSAQNFTITVNPIPEILDMTDLTFCNNSLTSVILPSGTGTSYNWTNSDPGIGLSQNGSGGIPSFTALNPTSSPVTGVIEYTPFFTNGGLTCQGQPESYNLTVNPSPTVDDPSDQVICNGGSTSSVVFTGTGTSYTWSNNTPSIGLSSSGTGNINPFNALNGNTTPITSTVIVTSQFTGGGTTCPGTQQSFSYTVNPTPSVIDALDQVVCNGSSTDQVTFSGTGTSYTWTNNTPSIGLSASGTGQVPSFTAVNTSSVPVTATITVTPVFTGSGVSCSGPVQSFTITVNPTPIVNDPSDVVVCANSSTSAVVFSGTGTSYSWTNNTSGIGLGSNGTGNINSFTAINGGITPVVATITVTPDFTGGSASCPGIAQTFTITVNPIPSVNDLPDQTICNGSSFAALLFTGTGTSYSWTNSLPSIGLSASGSGNIGAFTGTNTTVSPQAGTLTVTPQYTNASLTCSGSVQTVTLTVNPTPSLTDPQDLVVCNGSASAAVIFSGTGTSYSWTNSNPLIGLASTGTGNIASFTAVNTTTSPVTSTITVVPSYSFNGVICDGPSQVFTITVNPTPTVSDPSDQVLCNGSSTQAVLFTGTGTSYSWTNTTPAIGLSGTGSGNISSFTATNSSSAPSTGTITVTPQYTNAGLTCQGTQQQFFITVNPTPVVNDPPDVTFCNGVQTQSVAFSGTGNLYTWTNTLTTIGLPASGTGNIPVFTTLNNSSSLQSVATISVTSFFEQSGVTCQGSTEIFTITVNPTTVLNDPLDQIVCNGLQTLPVVFNGTGTEYQWSNTLPGIGLASNGAGNIQAFTAINTGSSAVTGVISVSPFYVSIDGTSCEGVGEDFSITVNPSPTANPIQDFSVCNNTTINVSLTANMNSNYSWFAESNPNVSGETTLPQPSSIVSNNLVNISASMQDIVYHVIPTSAPEGCQGPEILFTVEIVPDVDLISPVNYEICSGGFVNAQLVSNVPATYTWIATDNPNVTGESVITQGGSFINDQLINNTTVPQLVIYSVFQTSVTASCDGAIRTIAVLVRPPLDLINDDLVEICSGESVDLLLEANVPANFNWFAIDNPDVSGESLSNQNTNLIDDELVNNTQEQQVVSYSIVASSQLNGCVSPVFTVNVLINPLPQLLNSGVQICSGESTEIDLAADLPSSFSWYAQNAPSVSGETQQEQNISQINDVLVNLSGISETVVYIVTATDASTGCSAAPVSIEVIVNPLPVIDFAPASFVLCNQSPVQFTNDSEAGLDFYWEFGDGAISIEEEPVHIYNNPGPYIVTLTGTNPLTGCVSSQDLDITLSVSPDVGFTVAENAGCTVFNALFTDTVNLPGSSILWNFGDGQTSNQPGTVDHQYNAGGCYDVSLTVTSSNGCVSSVLQEDYVCVYDVPFAAFTAVSDTMLTTDPVFEFINNSVNAFTYLWDFGDGNTSLATNPIHNFGEEPTSHVVTLYAYNEVGCYDSTFYTVVVFEELLVYVPNSFTPNNNGTNDIFLPVMTSGFNRDSYRLTIFNRWGEEVFSTTDPEAGWDGSFKGSEVQTGVYTWKITFGALQNDDAFEYTGHVNLVR
jgi:gliding motility-associated-like protein